MALPTVVIVHRRERRSKCTVLPLKGHEDFQFIRYPLRHEPPPLVNYVRLAVDAPPLSRADAAGGLLILDGTWRLTAKMEKLFPNVPTRGLPPIKTAYPRVSKVSDDPDQGLATIEAVYAAHVILGRDTSGLLNHYHWRDEFLELNDDWLRQYG